MRSRGAGVIGARVYPLYGSASGVWNLGECFQWRKEGTWPQREITLSPISSPVDATVSGTATILASVYAGYPSASYRWEKSTNGGATWSVVSGQTTESITLTGLTSSNDGDLYRFVVTAGIRSKKSNIVTIWRDTISSLSWDTQPENTSVANGDPAYFYSVASATGVTHSVSYWTFASGTSELVSQWQQSTNGGSTWSDIPGVTVWYTGFAADSSMNGYKYRAKVVIAGTAYYSNAATLTVT